MNDDLSTLINEVREKLDLPTIDDSTEVLRQLRHAKRELAKEGDPGELPRCPFTLRDARPVKRKLGGQTVEVLRLEGHASVFNFEYEVFGGPAVGGWFESLSSAAFDKTLDADPDVVFLLNHEGMTMARTKSGTLKLAADKQGLYQRADLDLRNADAVKLGTAIERGDIDEMSFAFWTREHRWSEHPEWPDDPMSARRLLEVDIHRGDVSAVNFGASSATDIDMVRSLQALNEQELTEALAIINKRLGKRQEASGSLEGSSQNAPSGDVLALLRIPDNPTLEQYLHESRTDRQTAGSAG